MPMPDDLVRKHIAALVAQAGQGRFAAVHRLQGTYWPDGPEDRTEPVAVEWLARWRPAQAAAPIPVCVCPGGRCPVCN